MNGFFASTDWAVVLATIVGPTAAVVISIWLDARARQRERRLSVINALLHGRTISNLAWNQAMLQLPLEFRTHDSVMERWEECTKAALDQRMNVELMDALTKSAMRVLGFSERAAGQVVRAAYKTSGVTREDDLREKALAALPSIAESTSRSAGAAESMLGIIKRDAAGPAAAA